MGGGIRSVLSSLDWQNHHRPCDAVFLAMLFFAAADIAPTTRLIMVTSSHCPWCEAFEEEVGSIYDKTPESLVFPILRVDVDEQFPDNLMISTLRFSRRPSSLCVKVRRWGVSRGIRDRNCSGGG